MSYDCRTNHWRMFHDIRATFVQHSCDIRETLAQCLPDEIASIYYHRPPHDVLTNVVRLSCDCRAKVLRLSHDGFARNDKPRKMNILASIETLDYEGIILRCWKELEGWKELDCWKVSRCWVCWTVEW